MSLFASRIRQEGSLPRQSLNHVCALRSAVSIDRVQSLEKSLRQNLCSLTLLLYYTILYYTILYYTILYYTILYYTILYYTILYYTILYYTILYYTILYYTILYYTILYYTILYYTILCYTILCHLDFYGACRHQSRLKTFLTLLCSMPGERGHQKECA